VVFSTVKSIPLLGHQGRNPTVDDLPIFRWGGRLPNAGATVLHHEGAGGAPSGGTTAFPIERISGLFS